MPALPGSVVELGRRVRTAQEQGRSEIGAILRQVRIDRRWRQLNLARHLCICVDTLRKIELGRSSPNPETEKRIREWLFRSKRF